MSRDVARFGRPKQTGSRPAQSFLGPRHDGFRPALVAYCLVAFIAAGALLFDSFNPPVVSVGLFYVAVILSGFWFPWSKAPFALALFTTLLIILGFWLSTPDDAPLWQVWANRTSDIGTVWLTAVFVWYIRLQAQQLQTQIDISNTLSRELTHRVGNSLQLVASFLRLRATKARSESSRQVLETASAHVICIGKIQQMLSHVGSSHVVNANTFIKELINELCSTLPDPDRIQVIVDAENADLSATIAIIIGALLIELINNALKHAFRGLHKGTLKVRFLNERDTSEYILEVEDDGIGMDPTQVSSGQGLETVTELARLMHGSITCQAVRSVDTRPGTIWRMIVPYRAQFKR